VDVEEIEVEMRSSSDEEPEEGVPTGKGSKGKSQVTAKQASQL